MLTKTEIVARAGCTESQYSHYQEHGWLAPCKPVGRKGGPTWLCPPDNIGRIHTIQQIPTSAQWNENVSLELMMQSKRLYTARAVQDALLLTLQHAEEAFAVQGYTEVAPAQIRKRIQQRTAMNARRYPEDQLFPLWITQELFFRFSGLQAPLEHDPDLRISNMKAAVLKSRDADILAAATIMIRGISNKSVRQGIDAICQHMAWDREILQRSMLLKHTCQYPHTLYQLFTPIFIILLLQNELDSKKWQDGQRFFRDIAEDAGKRRILPGHRVSRPDWQR